MKPSSKCVVGGPVLNGNELIRVVRLAADEYSFESWIDGAWREDDSLRYGDFLSNDAVYASPSDFRRFGVPVSERVYEADAEIPSEWLNEARMDPMPDELRPKYSENR